MYDESVKWLFILLIIVILILIFVYNVIQCNEDKILYNPCKRDVWRPKIPYKSFYLNINNPSDICQYGERKNNSEYINGWYFNNFRGKNTILFCHGNNLNMTYRDYIINICHKFKLNLFIFDYRGYGKSCSFPHKQFLKEDGETAYHFLKNYCKISPSNIIVWGESLGGISASWIASKYKCGGLILFSCFSSLDDALTYRFSGHSKTAVKWLTSLLACKMDMVPVKEYLCSVKCPVAIVHSTEDEVLPFSCSWINYHKIPHEQRLHIKIKGEHASPKIKSSQFRELFHFFNLSLEEISCNLSDVLSDLKDVGKKMKKKQYALEK